MESLGEVPVAVIEKAKTCGGHNLSRRGDAPGAAAGAVPRPLARGLARGAVRVRRGDQGVGLHAPDRQDARSRCRSRRCRTSRTTATRWSRSRRSLATSSAGRGGRRLHPDRDAATQLIVDDGRSSACAPATRAAARTASRSATSSRAPTSRRRVTVLAEGCWGHLTGAAIKEFDLGEEPRAAGLGARGQGGLEGPQAAGPRDPHDRQPWPLKVSAQVRADRRHLAVPDEGREDRRRPRLDRVRRRPRLSPTRPPPPTTCCSSSSCTRSSRASSRAASGSPGARRRCPAAATGRCRS